MTSTGLGISTSGLGGSVLSGEVISFASEDRELSGYLVRPAAQREDSPGVLVIHEIFGLNDDIRSIARRFAAAGYVALAVVLLIP